MYVVVVHFESHAQHTKAFLDRVRQQARDSLDNEPNCHVFDVCIDPDAPDTTMLYEVYENQTAFEAHLKSSHFLAFDAEVSDWVASKRVDIFERLD